MLILVEKDTEPTVLQYTVGKEPIPGGIAGYSFTLVIGSTTPVSKVAAIQDAAAGLIRFDWVAGDLQQGDWEAEVLVTNPQGKERTLKIPKLRILKRLPRPVAP
jgi:hypothetical protein